MGRPGRHVGWAGLGVALVLVGCGGVPQPKRKRLSVHGVSGTAVRDDFDFVGRSRFRRTGGHVRYEYNNGSGLLFGTHAALHVQTASDEADTRVVGAASISTGRINRRSGIEAGMAAFFANDTTGLPWLRLMLGDMQSYRIGVTFGPDEPLVAVHVAHLHLRVIAETIEFQVGISSASRAMITDRIDLEQPNDEGPLATLEVRWKAPVFGLDLGFMAGAFDLARVGVFFDFE